MKQALGLTAPGPCFVLNADTWLEFDMQAMLAAHRQAASRLTMAVRPLEDVGRFGALEIEAGRVVGFHEKGRSGPGAINAGVYLMEASVLEGLGLPERFSIETDFLMPQVSRLRPLAFEVQGDFIDIGVPEDYERAQQLFAPHA